MKVSYKKIKRKCSRIVDHYYGLTAYDFLDEADIVTMDQHHIWAVIARGRLECLRHD